MKDKVRISVRSGRGGDGCVSFRREKYIPRGGPDGGDGGRGGHVFIRAKDKIPSLDQIKNNSVISAGKGRPGGGKKMAGRHGDDTTLDVPPGTAVYDAETGTLLGELLAPGEKFLAAEGGAGGRGNCHYATPTNRVPRESEAGGPGLEREIELVFSIPADAAVVGLPGAGKSALVGAATRSRSKVGDYPFTTRSIHIGVVKMDNYRSFKIVDMPALVEGSSEGRGIGNSFLIHLNRVKVVIFLLDPMEPEGTPLARQFEILKNEIAACDESYLDKTAFAVVNKLDAAGSEAEAEIKKLKKAIRGAKLFRVSARTGDGLAELSAAIMETVGSVEK